MRRPSKLVFFLFFALSLFLYFYRAPKMLAFDADQEFYANEYLKIANEHKFTLLGIETSVGGMFVGPLYTYANAFVYWLFRGDPAGIFDITLIFVSLQPGLTYYLFTKIKSKKVGFLAGLLVLFSASLWNKAFAPSAINLLYPMGLFFFYILVRLKEKKNYFFWLGVILALALQIHFSLFFLFPITLVFLLWRRLITEKNARNLFCTALLIFISLSPLIVFDFRHRLFITNNLWKFITQNSTLQGPVFAVFWGLVELFSHILVPKPAAFIYLFLGLVLIYFAAKVKKEYPLKVAGLIYLVSILLFILYRGPKPDYFFYFLLAPFFFTTADFLALFLENKILKYAVFLFFFLTAILNLQFINTTLNHYNYNLKKQVAEYIKRESQGKKVKVSYDTDLGLGFGFDYLIKYTGVNVDSNDFEENYHIVIKNYENYPGVEFKEAASPVSIKVAKIEKR